MRFFSGSRRAPPARGVCRLRGCAFGLSSVDRANRLTNENNCLGTRKKVKGDKEPEDKRKCCTVFVVKFFPFAFRPAALSVAGAGAQLCGAELLQDFPRPGPDGGAVRGPVLRRIAAG